MMIIIILLQLLLQLLLLSYNNVPFYATVCSPITIRNIVPSGSYFAGLLAMSTSALVFVLKDQYICSKTSRLR